MQSDKFLPSFHIIGCTVININVPGILLVYQAMCCASRVKARDIYDYRFACTKSRVLCLDLHDDNVLVKEATPWFN